MACMIWVSKCRYRRWQPRCLLLSVSDSENFFHYPNLTWTLDLSESGTCRCIEVNSTTISNLNSLGDAKRTKLRISDNKYSMPMLTAVQATFQLKDYEQTIQTPLIRLSYPAEAAA